MVNRRAGKAFKAGGWTRLSSIYVFPVADVENSQGSFAVVDFVYDSVVAYADSPAIAACQL